jgi:predicted negative regulator of RcsB-dependent stress response
VKKQKLKEYNDLEVFHSYCEQHVQTGISIAILAAVAIIGESKIIEHYPEEVTSYSFKYEQYVNDIHKKWATNTQNFMHILRRDLFMMSVWGSMVKVFSKDIISCIRSTPNI